MKTQQQHTYQRQSKNDDEQEEAAKHQANVEPVGSDQDLSVDCNAILDDDAGRGREERTILCTLCSFGHHADELQYGTLQIN